MCAFIHPQLFALYGSDYLKIKVDDMLLFACAICKHIFLHTEKMCTGGMQCPLNYTEQLIHYVRADRGSGRSVKAFQPITLSDF